MKSPRERKIILSVGTIERNPTWLKYASEQRRGNERCYKGADRGQTMGAY